MDILTKEQTNEFIRKLQNFDSKRGIKKVNLNILEPRFFDIILTKLKPTKVLEMERVSDSCEQVCNEYGIEYSYSYSRLAKENWVLPKEWDGDIIIGLISCNIAKKVVSEGLNLLQEGKRLAIYQPYSFVESMGRYLTLFKDRPFSYMYLTIGRPCSSPDGETFMPVRNGAWFVWEKTDKPVVPQIEWIEDELWEKYFVLDERGKVLKPDKFSRVYKRPIKVRVDRGRPSQAKK